MPEIICYIKKGVNDDVLRKLINYLSGELLSVEDKIRICLEPVTLPESSCAQNNL